MIKEIKVFVPVDSKEADVTLYTSDDFPIYLNEETKICLSVQELENYVEERTERVRKIGEKYSSFFMDVMDGVKPEDAAKNNNLL